MSDAKDNPIKVYVNTLAYAARGEAPPEPYGIYINSKGDTIKVDANLKLEVINQQLIPVYTLPEIPNIKWGGLDALSN